jgi:DNA-binding MarR family transcriptional regulator
MRRRGVPGMRLEKEMEAVTRALYEWEEEFMRAVAASGLTARQMHHLDAIARMDNPSPSRIAAGLGLTKPSVTDLLGRLGAAGHVRKSRSAADRRGYHIHVTAKGMGFVEEHRAVHRRLASLFTSTLSAGEVDTLEALIRKVVAVLETGKTPRGRRGGRQPTTGVKRRR